MEPHLRRLTSDDWQLFRDIRLEALQQGAHVFGSSYAREVEFTESMWRSRLPDDRSAAIWALFDGDECVGLTGAVCDRNDPDVAVFIASYLRPAYRGRKLSALYYQARIAWAKAEGFKVAHISHRSGNDASRGANQKFGFRYTHTEKVIWHDGSDAEECFYILPL